LGVFQIRWIGFGQTDAAEAAHVLTLLVLVKWINSLGRFLLLKKKLKNQPG